MLHRLCLRIIPQSFAESLLYFCRYESNETIDENSLKGKESGKIIKSSEHISFLLIAISSVLMEISSSFNVSDFTLLDS